MSGETLEKLSAMLDGELSPEEMAAMARRLAEEEALRRAWARYHLIGEVLRGDSSPGVPRDFAARLSALIEREPPVLARARHSRITMPKPLLGAALAAAVALAAVLGLRKAGDAAPPVETAGPLLAGRDASAEAHGPLAPRGEARGWAPAPPAPQASQSRLHRYLVDYSERQAAMGGVGMLPYVRVVSDSEPVPER